MTIPISPLEALHKTWHAKHPFDGYTLSNVLGRGAQGLVFHGRRISTGRRVAIKAVPIGEAEADPQRAEFISALEHPHLVGVIDCGGNSQINWVVFEFGGEETLSTLINDGSLTPQLLRNTILGIARAMQFLHSRGIVHRDIKPSNILIREGHARLGDFGLLAPAPKTDERSPILPEGTPNYCAPEVRRGTPPKESADIYAWGRTLEEGLMALARGGLVGCHQDLDDMVTETTAEDPSRRLSATAIIQALEGGSTRAPTATPGGPRRQSRPVRFLSGLATGSPSRPVAFRTRNQP